MERREFLGLGAACALALTMRRTREPTRIALVAPHAARAAPLSAALDGVRFGAEEAAHTFALLGRELELIEGAVPDAVAVVSLVDDVPDAALVVDARAHVEPRDCAARGAFRVGTSAPDAMLWHASLFRYGATQLNDRFARRFGRGMDGHAWAGWFALKALAEAALRARTADPAALAAWMLGPRARFDGHKGVPLWFDRGRTLIQPTYRATADGLETLQPAEPCDA